VKDYQAAFPPEKRFPSPSLLATNYYDSTMAMILSLRQVNGDLSDNQSKLKAARVNEKEFSTSKFAVGEKVDNAADDHEGGTVIAVFPTVDGNFRYAVDMEGYGALQFFAEEKLVVHLG
jgi:hypothetical protein